MGISERVIAVVGAGLLLAAAGGCSRENEPTGSGETVVAAPGALRTVSEVEGVTLTALSDLPRSPESGEVDDYCDGYRALGVTAIGKAVEARGWVVTSEGQLGRYRVISFVSGFDPSTSAICNARNANVGVFDGTQLVALAYAPHGSRTVLGVVEPMDNGALLVWGENPGVPVGELHLDGDRLRMTAVAPERAFCGRVVIVPNIYGKSIEAARTDLIAQGWTPRPPEERPGDIDGASALARRGVIEAETCSGTGMGYCAFNYAGPRGGSLSVTTVGGSDEGYTTVVRYAVTCPTYR